MTSDEENVKAEPGAKDSSGADAVLAPATPGAEALPLPEDQVDKPSQR